MSILSILSTIAFTGLFVHFAFQGVVFPAFESRTSTLSETDPQRSDKGNDASACGRPARIFIPNVQSKWPWPRRLHPHYAELEKEVTAWIASLNLFSPKFLDAMNGCKPILLMCLAHPNVNKEHARAACVFVCLTYVCDESADTSKATPIEVQAQRDAIMDALQNPQAPRPKGEWVGGEFARQFWKHAIQHSTEAWQKRFIQHMDEYTTSLVEESKSKVGGRISDVQSFIKLRRFTAAVGPSLCLVELGLDIPDQMMSHPAIQEMTLAANDLVTFSNDIFSYNVEQMTGNDQHNMITCIMKEYDTDANGAIRCVEQFLSRAEERFHAAKDALPELKEPLRSRVNEYYDGCGQWVRAAHDWSFECNRYFGDKGVAVMECGLMALLPKDGGREIGSVYIDGFLM